VAGCVTCLGTPIDGSGAGLVDVALDSGILKTWLLLMDGLPFVVLPAAFERVERLQERTWELTGDTERECCD
jgi:hypothetical protein